MRTGRVVREPCSARWVSRQAEQAAEKKKSLPEKVVDKKGGLTIIHSLLGLVPVDL
jgi:hypothetical protein